MKKLSLWCLFVCPFALGTPSVVTSAAPFLGSWQKVESGSDASCPAQVRVESGESRFRGPFVELKGLDSQGRRLPLNTFNPVVFNAFGRRPDCIGFAGLSGCNVSRFLSPTELVKFGTGRLMGFVTMRTREQLTLPSADTLLYFYERKGRRIRTCRYDRS